LERLKKEQEENDAKVRMEKDLAKQKHDDIVSKAIAQGNAMKPILEQQQKDELMQQMSQKKAEAEQKA
jgi:hypothetical protein